MRGIVGKLAKLAVVSGGLSLAVACGGTTETLFLQLEPKSGSINGDQPVKITGRNFRPDMGYTIYFGTKKAKAVTIVDPETMLVATPQVDNAGEVDITVRADDGNAWKITKAFRYEGQASGQPATRY